LTIRDVIIAIEGDITFSNCSREPNGCRRLPDCALAELLKSAQDKALEVLGNVSFHELAEKEKAVTNQD